MAEEYSWNFEGKPPLLVEENALKLFLDEMSRRFPEIEFSAKFADEIRIKRTSPDRLLAEISKFGRELMAIEVYGHCPTMTDPPYEREGSLIMEIGGEGWWRVFNVRLTRKDDTFYALKDRIEQFYYNSRPWYARIYGMPASAWAVIALIFSFITSAVIVQAIFKGAVLYWGNEVVVSWLDSDRKSSLFLLFMGVVSLMFFFAHAIIEKQIRNLFPASVILIGSAKRKFERGNEVRKWALGTLATLVLSGLGWLIYS